MSDPIRPRRPDFGLLRQEWLRVAGISMVALWQLVVVTARLVGLALQRGLGVLLALILLFEQWGWKPLAAALGSLARLKPIAALEGSIRRLPPYVALIAFALPTTLLIPLKLFALFLIANGHTASAAALFIGAKVVGTAVVARLYSLTEPKLMQIIWFKTAYGMVMPRLHALHEEIRRSWAWRYGRIVKAQAKRALAPMVATLRARLAELFASRGGPL